MSAAVSQVIKNEKDVIKSANETIKYSFTKKEGNKYEIGIRRFGDVLREMMVELKFSELYCTAGNLPRFVAPQGYLPIPDSDGFYCEKSPNSISIVTFSHVFEDNRLSGSSTNKIQQHEFFSSKIIKSAKLLVDDKIRSELDVDSFLLDCYCGDGKKMPKNAMTKPNLGEIRIRIPLNLGAINMMLGDEKSAFSAFKLEIEVEDIYNLIKMVPSYWKCQKDETTFFGAKKLGDTYEKMETRRTIEDIIIPDTYINGGRLLEVNLVGNYTFYSPLSKVSPPTPTRRVIARKRTKAEGRKKQITFEEFNGRTIKELIIGFRPAADQISPDLRHEFNRTTRYEEPEITNFNITMPQLVAGTKKDTFIVTKQIKTIRRDSIVKNFSVLAQRITILQFDRDFDLAAENQDIYYYKFVGEDSNSPMFIEKDLMFEINFDQYINVDIVVDAICEE